ncbi:cobalamin biosynthesis protein [Rhizobium phage RHph_N1_15]|nr:cobalamin biosynthesis protein [Rhizobium phage RHph_N1_10]QIG69282.1 cobalamin biosynthesis protein [Rhizobium phage RHph_N1_15]QIG75142.1 cobalamin biosynthesis protein [Rhizobium phage RHph_N2_6]
MNNDIVILREAIKKIVPMLAGKGLTVTQMGTQAYVKPHPVTGLPWIVNIPLLPDNAAPEFVVAIQGFIDHEVGHVLFTDFLYKGREKTKRLHSLHNIIEDTMIERLMGNEFPGSKRNIAKLQEFFVKNITEPALRTAGSKQIEFDYLIVPLTRALAGHQIFQDWMDENKHWDHELVKAFMDRFSQASKDKMPLLATTQETYEIALEIEAILYPPPPPAPPEPQPPEEEEQEPEDQDQGEGSDDQEPSDGEDDQDHSEEQQTGDGEGKGEREHTEDNDNASGGEGESDEEEKEDDAGDGESEGSGEGEKEADDEDGDEEPGAGSSDGSDDDETGDQEAGQEDGKGSSGDDDDADAGEQPEESEGSGSAEKDDSDDADDQDAAGDAGNGSDDRDEEGGSADDRSAEEAEESDTQEGSDQNDQADEPAEEAEDVESGGQAGDSDAGTDDDESDAGEEEADGAPDLNNLAIEDTGGDEDGEPESAEEDDQAPELNGIGYDPSQNPFAEMTDDALDEKDLSSALVKIIVKDAIAACRAADYSIFTREYDVIQPLKVPEVDEEPDAKKKFRSKWVVELEEETRSLTGVMQKDIERMMAAQSRVFNVAGQRSGRLNSAGLHRLTAGDARVFSRREEIRGKDTAVSLLSDCSGSMRQAPMATALSASYALASVLERCNIPAECMGFTTISTYGDETPMSEERVKQWREDLLEETQKSGVRFSRTTPIYMPIFKEFHERINAEVKKRFAYQRKVQPFMGGNIDGESLEYAAMRLAKRKEKRKVIIVLSDGFPAGARGDDEHLKYMVERLTKAGYDLVGIGIKSNAVARFYDNYLVLNTVEELPHAVMGELKKILMK